MSKMEVAVVESAVTVVDKLELTLQEESEKSATVAVLEALDAHDT